MDIQFRLRVRKDDLVVVGPGKIALLEAIAATGSISAAARALGMSYRRAWNLVDEMNRGLVQPVVDTAAGGAQGGGAVLTALAQEMVERYRAIEARAEEAVAGDLAWLCSKIAK